MTKFRLLKHCGCNLIGHRLSCKNSCHRSLDTRRQCDLPSKSMYHCRLSQTLMRKIWCLMFDETIYKVPKKSFCIKIEINCFESDICMVSHDNLFLFFPWYSLLHGILHKELETKTRKQKRWISFFERILVDINHNTLSLLHFHCHSSYQPRWNNDI